MTKGGKSPLFIGITVALLLAILIVLLVVFGFQMTEVSKGIERHNETLMGAVRDNRATLDDLRQNLVLIAEDSNQARDALKLPVRDYPILRPPAVSRKPQTDPRGVFLNGLDAILGERARRVIHDRLAELLASPAFSRAERETGISSPRSGDRTLSLEKGGQPYFSITVDPATSEFRVSDFLGETTTAAGVDEGFVRFLESRTKVLDRHYARLVSERRRFAAVTQLPMVQLVTRENELVIAPPTRNAIGYSMIIEQAGSTLLTATLNARTLAVRVGDHTYDSVAAFANGFVNDLRRLDLTHSTKERVEAAKQRIVSLRADPSFRLALSAHDLTLRLTPREDIDYFHYDLIDKAGRRVGSFAVQKKLGTIYLADSEDVTISALETLSVDGFEAKKKRIATDSAPQPRTTDFLLCGAHQNETDSIVAVHADRAKGKITLISVPRDLFYKGRKINAVYELYGPAELTREIAQITGLPMHKYIVIDMYAFIDVVNILGGIDLTLSTPVVDPTYRVRNDGEWTTLRYGAGTYHLDGIEALRIARSRHTSSDFVRARRQQLILGAIRRKIEKMGPLDVSKLSNLAGVFFRYVDTNFTPTELVGLFLAYRDVPIAGRYVIDTANVLYQTYANTYYLGGSGEQRTGSSGMGAWIVLPKNDDWNVIRQYVGKILGGEAP